MLNQVVLVARSQVIFLERLQGRYWRKSGCGTNLRISSGNIWRKLGVELSDSCFSNLGGHFCEAIMHVTIEAAEAAIEAARKRAIELGTEMCIAVVDSGANLKAFYRMDAAWVGSIDIAIKKAKTAVFFGMPTGQIGKLSQPGGSLFGIEHSNDGLITFPGGLPIVDKEGILIGAIGVSGSTVENDHAVAQAGVSVVGVSDLPAHPWRT